MRIVAISDTHERHGFSVPAGDVLVHAGDLTMRGDFGAIRKAGEWLRSLSHARKIVIAGNHDWLFERDAELARSALGDGQHGLSYLQDSGVTVDGIVFWGSPWQPWFYDWAFNVRRGPALAAKWAAIPADVDVLVTHGPPLNVLDKVGSDHVGCADLAQRVKAIAPKAHIFGHIHEGSGMDVQTATTYVNASVCDERYFPTNPARIIDL